MEEWKRFKDTKYFVNKEGQVRGLKGWELTPWKCGRGYPSIELRHDGKKITKTVHRMVAETFIPNPENKKTVNHKNGVKTDNRIENLEWNTYSENSLHALRTGLSLPKRGEKNGMAKLTWEIVAQIRKEYIPRLVTLKILADRYNVTPQLVSYVVNNKIWKVSE